MPTVRQALFPGFILFLIQLAIPPSTFAQADGDPVTLGTYRVIHSEILGEDRVLQVHLPPGYEDGELSYPVVYLFYSDHLETYFAQAVHDLHLLTIDRMPQVILVGVANTQRYRDLLAWPQEGRPDTGRADRFLRFVREELIPHVDSSYRTKPYRIMVGPQAAAVFGAYALVDAPGTFQAFVLNDPCRQDTEERSLCRAVVDLAATARGQGIYFAVSHDVGDPRWDYRHLRELEEGLSSRAKDSFRWRIVLVEDWPFFLAPVQLQESLLDLFAGYPFDPSQGTPDLGSIRAHFEGLSRKLGFQVDPPDLILVFSSERLVEEGDYDKALAILNHLVELYPGSMNGPWQLANLHREMGDTARAIEYYEECLRRDPNMIPARQWLERLRGLDIRP